jgi:L,D-transpeptidase YbiS
MKKLWLWVIIVIAVPLMAFFVYQGITAQRNLKQLKTLAFSDSTPAELPKDKAQAQKELQRVQRALSKLKPSKPYIVIDRHANRVRLRTEDSVLFEAVCSTGSGGELVDTLSGRRWVFNTPSGVFKVNSKLVDPWWRKPDWAFFEENEEIPTDPRERYDPEMLGEFAMGFGDGYFIHGTIYERLLGINVTHGCVRLGSKDLKYIYDRVSIGTPVYIF